MYLYCTRMYIHVSITACMYLYILPGLKASCVAAIQRGLALLERDVDPRLRCQRLLRSPWENAMGTLQGAEATQGNRQGKIIPLIGP